MDEHLADIYEEYDRFLKKIAEEAESREDDKAFKGNK
jgi:hypothetical protein